MDGPAIALFDTAIGRCGIAWGPRGVRAVRLPEGSDDRLRASLQRACPGAREADPPAAVRDAISAIRALLGGEARDLLDVGLDLEGVPAFNARVYAALRLVLPGSTVTYGELARRVGEPGAARAVGQAMGENPCPIVVPCHRVLAAAGRGGFSAPGGVDTKLRLLAIEGGLRQGELFAG
jgi:methylated-DNA-[protein]-cysteine S-methyltransferase